MLQIRLYGIWIVVMLAAMVLAACTRGGDNNTITLKGSGTIVEQPYDLADFDAVDASQTFDVTITPGDGFSVVVRTDDNVQQYLDVRVKDNTLLLGLDDDHSYSFDGSVTLEAAITMPKLTGIWASGVSSVVTGGFTSEQAFAVNASGASRVTFDTMEMDAVTLEASGSSEIAGEFQAAGDMVLNASGTSNITLDGSGGDLRMEVSGVSQIKGTLNASGDVTLDASGPSFVMLAGSGGTLTLTASGGSAATLVGFVVTDATVEASGSSDVVLHLNGTLSVEASGTSRVRYQGDVVLGEIKQSGEAAVSALE